MGNDGISIEPGVMGGRPVFAGTRVTVEQIVRECSRGLAVAEVVAQYPRLRKVDVLAALRFAADELADEITTAAE